MMTGAAFDAIGNDIASVITHTGLVDKNGVELSGGAPAYARKAVTWTPAVDGQIRMTTDLVFDVPPGASVGGLRWYTAEGIDLGGVNLPTEYFNGQGEYLLKGAKTGFKMGSSS